MEVERGCTCTSRAPRKNRSVTGWVHGRIKWVRRPRHASMHSREHAAENWRAGVFRTAEPPQYIADGHHLVVTRSAIARFEALCELCRMGRERKGGWAARRWRTASLNTFRRCFGHRRCTRAARPLVTRFQASQHTTRLPVSSIPSTVRKTSVSFPSFLSSTSMEQVVLQALLLPSP